MLAGFMKRFLLQALLLLALSAAAHCREPSRLLPKTNVLPLALDDSIQFRKTIFFNNDARTWRPTAEDMIRFERLRMNYGAVSGIDRTQRWGNYYTFFWRTKRPADVTLRFEYTQEQLGAHVQAQERTYKGAKGSMRSEFSVTGDSYLQEGRVTAWRAIVIENGRIVALNQSYLWR
jgi:hypothetical protein